MKKILCIAALLLCQPFSAQAIVDPNFPSPMDKASITRLEMNAVNIAQIENVCLKKSFYGYKECDGAFLHKNDLTAPFVPSKGSEDKLIYSSDSGRRAYIKNAPIARKVTAEVNVLVSNLMLDLSAMRGLCLQLYKVEEWRRLVLQSFIRTLTGFGAAYETAYNVIRKQKPWITDFRSFLREVGLLEYVSENGHVNAALYNSYTDFYHQVFKQQTLVKSVEESLEKQKKSLAASQKFYAKANSETPFKKMASEYAEPLKTLLNKMKDLNTGVATDMATVEKELASLKNPSTDIGKAMKSNIIHVNGIGDMKMKANMDTTFGPQFRKLKSDWEAWKTKN